MTDQRQTEWQISKKMRPRRAVISGAYVCVWSIPRKALPCAVRPLKCPLVSVLPLRVGLIGISQGGQAAVEAALGQAVNFTVHPLHRVTEGQRVTVLIHVGRAGRPGGKERTASPEGLPCARPQGKRGTEWIPEDWHFHFCQEPQCNPWLSIGGNKMFKVVLVPSLQQSIKIKTL